MNQNLDAGHATEIRELVKERDDAAAKSNMYGGLDQREKRAAEAKRAWKEAPERNRHGNVVNKAALAAIDRPDGQGKRWKDLGTIKLEPGS
jgi:hypothetical protein